jgi:2-polyprenyl-3-methyl-5-hydroxy-6-metoxy-1,4-benzoquinol methylase
VDYELYHASGRTADFGDVAERVRVRTVLSILSRLSVLADARTVLDLGSGEGRYLPIWHRSFPDARIIAVECSSLAMQRSAARHTFAEHVLARAESIPIQSNSIDGVVSIEVLEHVEDSRQMLSECYRVLKPSGWALISTPCGNVGSLEWAINFFGRSIRPGHNLGIIFGKTEDPTHLRRYRSVELRRLSAAHGFVLEHQFFNGHGFLTVANRLELFVNGHLNIGRRSRNAADSFVRLLDGIGMMDWRLLRRLPNGSTMIVLLRKPAQWEVTECR